MKNTDLKTGETAALVTGASSGLGISFATELAKRGHNLVLVARRKEPMCELAARLEQEYRIKVVVEPLDLSVDGSAQVLAEHIDATGIEVDILVNNAAFAVSGLFLDQDLDRLNSMLQLDVLAVTNLTHVFGRRMAKRGRGHILLVASVGAYTPSPFAAAYSAAKSYVLSLGVALRRELTPHVGVTVMSPGLMETEFHQVADYAINPAMRRSILPTDRVAKIGLDAMFARRADVVAGWLNAIGAFMSRLLPRSTLAHMTYDISKP